MKEWSLSRLVDPSQDRQELDSRLCGNNEDHCRFWKEGEDVGRWLVLRVRETRASPSADQLGPIFTGKILDREAGS